MKTTITRLAAPALALAALAWTGIAGTTAADADEMTAQAPPSHLRRLTQAQYRQAIADVFGPDIKVVGRFEPDLRVEGLLALGASAVSVTPGGLEQYEEIARGIAGEVTDAAHRERLVGCAPGPADPQGAQCAAGFLGRVGLKLYRRPLARAELATLTGVALESAERLGDFHAGLAAALTGVLTSPHFLFRVDAQNRSGKALDGYSRASRLSYLLWNAAPDDALLAAAGNGTLETPEGLRREVDRMMASPRLNDGVRAFFTDFLMLDEMDRLSKDVLIFPAFTPAIAADLREQTLRTITDELVARNGSYMDLFTSRRIAMKRSLGPIYDVPVAGTDWHIYEFPDGDPRTGLLTHASMLALHSHPGRTSPTLRGKAMREVLLCEKVPPPPANVSFAVVQDVTNAALKTTRARLQAHLDDEECSSCHKVTDPVGLGLEQFDGAGRFRSRENGEIIDVTGTFERAAFDGAAQLGRLFGQSEQISQCLVRTAWRYANGRDPARGDEPALAALQVRFSGEGHRFTGLLRAIALDPSFHALPTRPRIAGN